MRDEQNLIDKSYKIVKNEGILALFQRSIWLFLYYIRRLLIKIAYKFSIRGRIENMRDAKKKFEAIYAHNYWGNDESRSGNGSSIEYTTGIRRELPLILDKYEVKKLLDAPCGDFYWMRHVIDARPFIDYTGCDIVEPLIADNNLKYGSSSVRFLVIDIINSELPDADMMINRDCLFHWSFADISQFLKNIHQSEVNYLLTTSYVHEEGEVNLNIETGDFRYIDLSKWPFFFPKESDKFEDYVDPFRFREMRLYKVENLPKSLKL